MKTGTHIFVSYHPAQERQAGELVKYLRQLEYSEHSISIGYMAGFLPGADEEIEKYQNIQSARIILVLPSVDYLIDCKEEFAEIAKSDCFKKKCVVPIPLPNVFCDWESTCLGRLKPLPYSPLKLLASDDSSFWHEVTKGLKLLLNGDHAVRFREIDTQRVRANSHTTGQSESMVLGTHESYTLRLRPHEVRFEVEGDSMLPFYQSGSILIGQSVAVDEIRIGVSQPYIINLKNQDPVLKYIKSIDKGTIKLASSNPYHPDFEVLKEDVISIFLPVPPDIRRNF
jgi:hypothetical protein